MTKSSVRIVLHVILVGKGFLPYIVVASVVSLPVAVNLYKECTLRFTPAGLPFGQIISEARMKLSEVSEP